MDYSLSPRTVIIRLVSQVVEADVEPKLIVVVLFVLFIFFSLLCVLSHP